MDIMDEIERIFEENGVDAQDKDQLMEMDSLQYMTIIVEIEQKYGIVFPDEYLERNMVEDFEEFVNAVVGLVDNSLDEDGVMLSEDITDK